MQKLSYCIRIRVNLELTKVRNLFGERQFVVRAGRALRNILSCVSGDHIHCNKRSPACTAHLATYTFSHLHLKQLLALCDEDRQTLQAEICRTLSSAIGQNRYSHMNRRTRCGAETFQHSVILHCIQVVRNLEISCEIIRNDEYSLPSLFYNE